MYKIYIKSGLTWLKLINLICTSLIGAMLVRELISLPIAIINNTVTSVNTTEMTYPVVLQIGLSCV